MGSGCSPELLDDLGEVVFYAPGFELRRRVRGLKRIVVCDQTLLHHDERVSAVWWVLVAEDHALHLAVGFVFVHFTPESRPQCGPSARQSLRRPPRGQSLGCYSGRRQGRSGRG